MYSISVEELFFNSRKYSFSESYYQQKIRKGDFVIFINGENEIGNNKIINTNFIEENYNALHQKYWKLYKVGIEYFYNLLPITQLYNVLFKK